MILFSFDFRIQILYLMVILFVIKEGLKNLEFINNKFIIFFLMGISIVINFIFYGISIKTLFESLISVSFVSLVCDMYSAINRS